jgi:hypothetical protein
MWFESAIGKEQVEFMFGGEFSLVDVQLENIFLHRMTSLRFQLICKNIPEIVPRKWKEKGFNVINLVFSMGEIHSLDIQGCKVGFICTPEIRSFPEKTILRIENDDLKLNCEARFLTIEGFTPGVDERWD